MPVRRRVETQLIPWFQESQWSVKQNQVSQQNSANEDLKSLIQQDTSQLQTEQCLISLHSDWYNGLMSRSTYKNVSFTNVY